MNRVYKFFLTTGFCCALMTGTAPAQAADSLMDFLPGQERERPIVKVDSDAQNIKTDHKKREKTGKTDKDVKSHKESAKYEAWKDKSPEERKAYWDEKRKKMEERINKLPPEEQEAARHKMKEHQERMEALREEMKDMTPQERKAHMESLRKGWDKTRKEHRAEFKQKFDERWDQSNEDERAAFCSKAKEHCDQDHERACKMIESKC